MENVREMEAAIANARGEAAAAGLPFDEKAFVNRVRKERIAHLQAALTDRIRDAEAAEKRGEFGPTPDEEKRKAREARQEAIRRAFQEASGIPDRYDEATLEGWEPANPDEAKVRTKLISWALMIGKPGCPSLGLQGAYGTGKTWMACGMLQDRFRRGEGGLFVTAKTYTGLIRESYRDDSKESESSILDRYAATPILVLDEVGRQFETKAEHLYLFDLINERYNRRRPTLFLTNLDIEQFRAFMGEALMDRIREGGGSILQLNWASRRG